MDPVVFAGVTAAVIPGSAKDHGLTIGITMSFSIVIILLVCSFICYHKKGQYFISVKRVSLYAPHSKVVGGYTGFTPSACPSIIYGHELPYMKKTRKKKQVCGAACFMAAEIKFSKDVRPSRILCQLCSAYTSGWIHFIFLHLIKQL